MKKIMIITAFAFSCSLLGAQTPAQELNNTGKVKKTMMEEKKEVKTEAKKEVEKLFTLTGIVKNIDTEKKTMTVDSVKKKGESMTFSFEGLKVKDGKKLIDASSLKVGDKVKIRYSGDINSPKIEKMMILKEEKKVEKKEKAEIKKETKEVKTENRPAEVKKENKPAKTPSTK